MGTEIERKFLVHDGRWRADVVTGHTIRQGYLSVDVDRVVRVRLLDDRGFITVKGRRRGATRAEFEYEIPAADAADMVDRLCLRPLIEKRRHVLGLPPGTWVVDEFLGAHEGLVLAEVELPSEASEPALPSWIDREVTTDDAYANSALVMMGVPGER